MGKVFIIDGWVYTQCINKNGKAICKEDGKYYKFRLYHKKEEQKTPSDKEEVSVAA